MKRKRVLALTAVFLLLSVLVSCGGAAGPSIEEQEEKAVLSGRIDISGSGLLPAQDGSLRQIAGEGYSVTATRNREYVVFLERDGSLFLVTEGEKNLIDNDVWTVRVVSDQSVLYTKCREKEKYYLPGDFSYSYRTAEFTNYRYLFASGETLELSMDDSFAYKTAKDTGVMLYSAYNKDTERYSLLRLPADSNEYEVLASGTDKLSPLGISLDGSCYAWSESTAQETTAYLFVNGERIKALSGDFSSGSAHFNDDGDLAVIVPSSSNTAALWTAEKGIQRIKLPSEPYSYSVFTETGVLSDWSAVSPGTVYLTVESGESNYAHLYALSVDGEREKLVSGLTDYSIRNGHLYYIGKDGEFNHARIEGGRLSQEEKIADGVCDFVLSPDGSAAVYTRDVASDQIGSLYLYIAGQDKPTKITNECYCYSYYGSYLLRASFTIDGKGIYYFTEPEIIKGNTNYTGTLQYYDIAGKTSTRIGSDVICRLESEFRSGCPSARGLWYYKYSYTDETGEVLADMMYWNGSETSVLAREIKYLNRFVAPSAAQAPAANQEPRAEATQAPRAT